jgi:hypothetical protein
MSRVPRTTALSGPLSFIPPLKPILSATPPEGDQWLPEVKHDGYRTELIVERGRARAYTMNGHDWTTRYRTLVAVADHLPCRSAILDGEAVVQRQDGVADFHALRAALSSEPHRIIYFAFDRSPLCAVPLGDADQQGFSEGAEGRGARHPGGEPSLRSQDRAADGAFEDHAARQHDGDDRPGAANAWRVDRNGSDRAVAR